MKYTFLIITCLISSLALSQTPAEINKAIGLPDSLTFEDEIRVYKQFETTNYTDVFRFYKEGETWHAHRYQFFSAVDYSNTEQHFIKATLKPAREGKYIWAAILNTNMAFLPPEEAIQHKLRGKLTFNEKEVRGDEFGSRVMMHVLDGERYDIFISGEHQHNYVSFGNPESYLEYFPGVDELESVVALINIIKDDFNIWKE